MKCRYYLLASFITGLTTFYSFTDFFCNPFEPLLRGRSFLSPRSQNTELARTMVGTQQFINNPDNCFHSYLSATGQYGRSFRAYRIAEYFFGTDTLSISGSQVASRDRTDILADYFGLSPEFSSTVHLDPQISTGLIDFNGYAQYGYWFGKCSIPLVWTKSRFTLREDISVQGTNIPFPALYMDTGIVEPATESFTRTMQTGLAFGQVEPRHYGNIIPCQKRNGVADIHLQLGYNIIQDEVSHLGFSGIVVIPTGNRSQAYSLFEPMIGNGHHYEVGVGFWGHWVIWEKDADQQIAIYLQANLTHLFSSLQRRSFDFGRQDFIFDNFKFASRYILIKEFDETGTYTGTTLPAINITTLPVKSHYDAQLDAVIMAGYHSCCWSFDIGYNAWARSKEHLCLCSTIAPNRYGFKGIQNVAGAASNNTQSEATIYGNPFSDQALVADNPSPVFITPADINIDSAAAPGAFTHQLFWHTSWAYHNDNCYFMDITPFLGCGGFIEFEGLNPRNFIQSNHNTISQWAFWIKGGFSFN